MIHNTDAVSPVISILLLLGLTISIAAIASVTVFDLFDAQNNSIDVTMTVDDSTATVVESTGADKLQLASNPTENITNVAAGGTLDLTKATDTPVSIVAFTGGGETRVIRQVKKATDPSELKARGGTTITGFTDSNEDVYRIHAFENTDDATFSVNNAPSDATVDVLVVGGGGGAGGIVSGDEAGGAGGAGGLAYAEGIEVSARDYEISVGDGGSAQPSANSNGNRGDDSIFDSGGSDELIGKAGGPGEAGQDTSGFDGSGGSGGGRTQESTSSENYRSTQSDFNGGVSELVFNLGSEGGAGNRDANRDDAGHGGGGATQKGQDRSSSISNDDGTNGGDGKDMSAFFGTEFGENGAFAGGGASVGRSDTNSDGVGGVGGGGTPGDTNNGAGVDGTGGGGAAAVPDGRRGGSGIVLVRYQVG